MLGLTEEQMTESKWLKGAKEALMQRDPVDAINDAEALVAFARDRLDKLLPPKERSAAE